MKSMVKSYAMPFLGMAFFWVYFRYQSFSDCSIPLSSTGALSGFPWFTPYF